VPPCGASSNPRIGGGLDPVVATLQLFRLHFCSGVLLQPSMQPAKTFCDDYQKPRQAGRPACKLKASECSGYHWCATCNKSGHGLVQRQCDLQFAHGRKKHVSVFRIPLQAEKAKL
jgi:hypothetical protein